MMLLLLLACGGEPAAPPTPWAPEAAAPVEPCEAVIVEMATVAGELGATWGEAVRAPDPAKVREACARMPPDVRPCLSVGWRLLNEEACAAAMAGLSDDDRALLEQALR